MALTILSANRVETLQGNLAVKLLEQPLQNPLAAEIIVVPTFAMSRWLNYRLAQQQGVAANIEYPSPTIWLWQLATCVLPNVAQSDPLSTESLSWQVFSRLPGLIDLPCFAQLHDYLSDDTSDIKRWQLSQHIAELFDRYQHYRPNLIREWSQHKLDDWQAKLWQSLLEVHADQHRVAVIDRLIRRLQQEQIIDNMPRRISLFAISSLPPLFIEVIQALSRHTDICLYQHSPTDQYWADLKNQKALARLRLQNATKAEYFEIGNELLASWGRQGQVMQDLLLDRSELPNTELDFSQAPGGDNLLHAIQQSIFDLDSKDLKAADDGSLTIHICHSAQRECQVLHDQLLLLLNKNPDLSHEDILVMAPNISLYAPYIESVFGHQETPSKPYLPWNLSDISIADEHPLIQSFLQLLDLPDSRFEYSAIMSFLEVAEIRRCFDIDDLALNDTYELIEAARVRWGIDAQFKENWGLPATKENTWGQARDRIFAAYALGEIDLWNGIAPLAQVQGDQATSLSKFWRLFDRLIYWREILKSPTDAREWQSRLNRLLEDFYVNLDPQEERLQQIRDTIDNLNLAQNCQLSPALLRSWLNQQLSAQTRQGRLFSGGISFCGMRPMRNLPFKIICLLGMNDAEFPRRPVISEFDKMARHWQSGDPRSGDEDRYLMLETLLCARENLYISYCGRSLKDNSECQPSVLVQELLDFVDNRFEFVDINIKLSQAITRIHPMQVFSETNYLPPRYGHDSNWYKVALKLMASKNPGLKQNWPLRVPSQKSKEIKQIDLVQLKRFLRHPVRYFFNSRFGIFLSEDQPLSDSENFRLDALSSWEIKTEVADGILKGQFNPLETLRAKGNLPHGEAAAVELDAIYQRQRHWLEQLGEYSGVSTLNKSINCQLANGQTLYGEVRRYYRNLGLMHYSASNLKGYHLLALWLDHLVLSASEQYAGRDTNLLVCADKNLVFKNLARDTALEFLSDISDLFIEAQSAILPIFPNCSYAYAKQTDPERAIIETQKAWATRSDFGLNGDSLNPYIALVLRDTDSAPINSTAFAEYANRIYRGLLDHRMDT